MERRIFMGEVVFMWLVSNKNPTFVPLFYA